MDVNIFKELKITLNGINKANIFYLIVVSLLVFNLFKDEIITYVKGYKTKSQIKADSLKKDSIVYKPDMFGDYIDDANLTYILQDMQDKYDCDYVNINLFHNGTVTPTGYHYKKMSSVTEVARKGLMTRGYKLQNWSIEPFKEKFKQLHIEKWVYIPEMEKDEDPYFSIQIPRYGINSVVYVAILDYRYKGKSGLPHLVGFMSFQYKVPTKLENNVLISMEKEVERVKEYVILK